MTATEPWMKMKYAQNIVVACPGSRVPSKEGAKLNEDDFVFSYIYVMSH
jgi:hypothetical protein